MRPHEEADALVIVAGGMLVAGLSIPFLKPFSIVAGLLLSLGALLIAFGIYRVRNL